MKTARIIPVYQSLIRHNHMLGAERNPIMLAGLVAAVTGLGGQSFIGIAISGIFWLISLFLLRKMANLDPMMSKVFLRYIQQQSFYSAKSSVWVFQGYKFKRVQK